MSYIANIFSLGFRESFEVQEYDKTVSCRHQYFAKSCKVFTHWWQPVQDGRRCLSPASYFCACTRNWYVSGPSYCTCCWPVQHEVGCRLQCGSGRSYATRPVPEYDDGVEYPRERAKSQGPLPPEGLAVPSWTRNLLCNCVFLFSQNKQAVQGISARCQSNLQQVFDAVNEC